VVPAVGHSHLTSRQPRGPDPGSPARIIVGGDHPALVRELGGRLRTGAPRLDVVAAPAGADGLLARELVLRPLPTAGVIVVDGSLGLTPDARRLTRLLGRFATRGMFLIVGGLDGRGDAESRVRELGQEWYEMAEEMSPPGANWEAMAGDQVVQGLLDLLDGADAAGEERRPRLAPADRFRLTVAWLAEASLLPGRAYALQLGEQTVSGTVAPLRYRLDLDTGEHIAATELSAGDIGACDVELSEPLAFSPYRERPAGGACRLTDPMTGELAGVAIIDFALNRAHNIRWQRVNVDKMDRAAHLGQQPTVLWLTGLSGAGKSTLANLIESELHSRGHHTYLLDGDNVRHGLNSDLGFTDADRVENIRRVAEVTRLMVDAGLIVLVSFISPFRAERAMARSLLDEGEFFEIYVDTPLSVAERRDTKGLYAKARRGQLQNFTGIDSPYEPPEHPEIHIDTTAMDAVAGARLVIEALERAGRLAGI